MARLLRAGAALSAVAALPGCAVYDYVSAEPSSGSVALGVDGQHLEVFVGVCEVQPDVIHLTLLRSPSDDPDIATWETPLGLDYGVTRVAEDDPAVEQVSGDEDIPIPARSVRLWVGPKDGNDLLPFTEATPAEIRGLAEDEVLTTGNGGKHLVMSEAEYEDDHCLGLSDHRS